MYRLVLHDFGNLALQLVMVSEDEDTLNEAAENMNNLFTKAGRGSQFVAEVEEVPELDEDFSDEGGNEIIDPVDEG